MNKIMKNIFVILVSLTMVLIVAIMFNSLSHDGTSCKYCRDPVKVYDNEEFVIKSYPVKRDIDTKTALAFSNWGKEDSWYLCIDDGFMEDDTPPTHMTTYYWTEVRYCPYCGRELNKS